MSAKDERIEAYYQLACWEGVSKYGLAGRVIRILDIVNNWCIEANDVGGVDATDLAFRLLEAGYALPDDGV